MIAFEAGHWTGLEGLGAEALAELRPRAEATVERVAMFFTGEVQKTLSGPRHGRAYQLGEQAVGFFARGKAVAFTARKGKGSNIHIASAPGEAPAVLTGRLRQSIAWTPPHWEDNTVTSEVGTNVVYAAIMEYGGIAGQVKIEARPYWAPTILRIEPAVERMFEEGL